MKIQRRAVDYESEYKKLQDRARRISKDLGIHEAKNLVKSTFPYNNYRKVDIDGHDFYYGGTNIFLIVTEIVIEEALKMFPKNFGNGNAVSVLHALNKTRFLHERIKDAIRIYGNENFVWVFDRLSDDNDSRILRLDLFRRLNKIPHKKRKWDFTGGIFHALKHFSIKGQPLSTGTDINDVQNIQSIIFLIIKAFFLIPGTFDGAGTTYTVTFDYDEKYNLKFIFYHEVNTKVYFLKTIYKIKKKKEK
ncbi:MAG: hypothetical protein EOO51_11465 [Flavobacterium sp.]|nr:MAG: hypothetical protein EOO51_11465 [Flavobacterium sp.]